MRELISVFLSPDEGLDLSADQIEERGGEQRLDGVLRFGDDLVVVIESKIVGEAPTDQAKLLRLRGVEVEESKVFGLGWHELLEDWWALIERGLLGPAERVLMEDLIAFAEEHFAHLLPFTTLERAGEHELRRQRRLMALLREATGIDEVQAALSPRVGAWVMLEAKSTQRIALHQEDEHLALISWPAELKPQAEALYGSDRAQQLVKFVADDPGVWRARPNVHLAYRGARTVAQRLYMTCDLELGEYVRRWSEEDAAQIRAHGHDEIRSKLWLWLRERRYASAEDDERVDAFLKGFGRRDAHLRPGIEVRRLWRWSAAVEFDKRGALVGEIKQAIVSLLTALEEPLPPGVAPERGAAVSSP